MKIEVIKERCPQNHRCPAVKICPINALKQSNNEAPTIDHNLCIKCGKCISFCPMKALIIKQV